MTGFAGKPRRVLIIVENLPVPFDRRVWQEATTLREAGYEVSIICPKMKGYTESRERIDGIDIFRHPLPFEATGVLGYLLEYGSALLWQTWLAWRIALTRGFDVIHACNPPDTIFLVAAPFKLWGKRFLFDHHDICPELFEAKFGRRSGLLYRMMRVLEWTTFRLADVSIATNHSYRAIAIERGGMDPERVFVVRSGPKLERMQPGPAVERWRNGRRHLVGYLGVMGRQEGIDLLLDMIEHVVKRRGRDDVQFVLVGGGTELEAMREYAARLGIADYVTFTGRVSDEVLLEAMNSAEICVNPDVPNEMNDKSTMNKVMEYMALGKPLVQFDLTEGRFSAQEASLYAEPNDIADFGDKVLALLDDPALARRMGAYGRQRVVEELSWEHEAPKLLAAYDVVFAPHATGAAAASSER